MYLVLILAIFVGPLFVFSPRLATVRRRGLIEYGALGSEYTRAFARKWISRDDLHMDPLVGSADIQSLADLANSYAIVRTMRIVPFDLARTITPIVAATVLPFLPLALFVLSPVEVIKGLLQVLL